MNQITSGFALILVLVSYSLAASVGHAPSPSVKQDMEFNTNGMGLPEEGDDEATHALHRQGQIKQELGAKMKKLNSIMEGNDEGFVPWVMGWIHSATNLVATEDHSAEH